MPSYPDALVPQAAPVSAMKTPMSCALVAFKAVPFSDGHVYSIRA